ncbi:MAG: hypothetical protein KJ698_00435 [Actinobacteria bacterium]|jgi:hypothetical protein|nr:hypothetical protein [Actinomycetota bacterium]
MNRRIGIALFVIFGLLAAWMFSKDVTFFRGMDIDYRLGTAEKVYVHCGDVIPILRDGEFAADVSQYLHDQCRKSARSHAAWIVLLGGIATASLVVGLVYGRGARLRDISVLRPLPTSAEMEEEVDA